LIVRLDGLLFEPMVRIDLTACRAICQLKRQARPDPAICHHRDFGKTRMGTVSKALELLNFFSRQRPLIGLSDLARLAEVNKATCFRLLSELADHGLVEQVGAGREYRLGPGLLRLATLREAAVPTRDAAMPILQSLAAATGETAHAALLVAGQLRTLAYAYDNSQITRVTMEDAEALPFHATSSGLVVLAFQPPAFLTGVLSQPMARLTHQTDTDPQSLKARLAEIKAKGHAESSGTFQTDVHSFAVPLFDAEGRCTGSLAVAALASRVTETQRRHILQTLQEAGRALTRQWGGTLPPAVATLWTTAA
jgi:IclR family transcriptional regulator, acetate operon repressor